MAEDLLERGSIEVEPRRLYVGEYTDFPGARYGVRRLKAGVNPVRAAGHNRFFRVQLFERLEQRIHRSTALRMCGQCPAFVAGRAHHSQQFIGHHK